jgi:hypothetical protein
LIKEDSVMSGERIEQSHVSNAGSSRSSYVEPAADWHDLRVITLGGTDGNGDSGSAGEVQLPPSVTNYDESSEDFDNYV